MERTAKVTKDRNKRPHKRLSYIDKNLRGAATGVAFIPPCPADMVIRTLPITIWML